MYVIYHWIEYDHSYNSSWIADMEAVLQVDELPQDVPGAEALLFSHAEHKAEIDTRQPSFASFKRQGETLIAANHYAKHEVS